MQMAREQKKLAKQKESKIASIEKEKRQQQKQIRRRPYSRLNSVSDNKSSSSNNNNNRGCYERIDRWLRQRLESADLADLAWLDRPSGLFRIDWRRSSCSKRSKADAVVINDGTNADERNHDAQKLQCGSVFSAWDCHRGRQSSSAEYRRLKQTLRCALNGSRRHLRYRRDLSRRSGAGAYRVYQFVATSSPADSIADASPDDIELINVNQLVDLVGMEDISWLATDSVLLKDSPLVSDSDPYLDS